MKGLKEVDKRRANSPVAMKRFLAATYKEIVGNQQDSNLSVPEVIRGIRHYFENIIAKIPGHIYWVDRNNILLGCNDEQAKDLGLSSRHDGVGQNIAKFQTKENAEIIVKTNQQVLASGISQTNEEPFIDSDGQKIIFLSHKVPLRDEKGEIIGLLGVSIDITEHRKTEEDLQQAKIKEKIQEERIEMTKAVGASIAHELRTPLMSIRGNMQALKGAFPDLVDGYLKAVKANLVEPNIAPRHLELLLTSLDEIETETYFSNTIIDMLLFKIGQQETDAAETGLFSILGCVDKAIRRYPFANTAQSQLVCVDDRQDFLFQGKELFVIHVLFNLLKNALFYVEEAQKGGITIWAVQGQDQNELHFKDTGTGISEEILPHIFEQFFSRTRNSTGIGLYFCKMVMHNLGGDIQCRSTKGEFAEFVLYFPAATKELS